MKSLQGILRARSQSASLRYVNATRLYSSDSNEKIEIPKRIPRGPTDILRALESTVGRDPTAAHYKFHDDPYLIPMSNSGKRAFAMARESGRKAAQWVREQHPELFLHQEADPPIQQFFPKATYNENSEVTEEDLKKTIENVLVSDALLVHKLCKEKGVTISPETELSFLELLCYNNSSDVLPDDLIEEKWFKQSASTKEKIRKTWKDSSAAEEIFIGIENPGSRAYSAIIRGMAKYYQVNRAYELFKEAEEKQIPLNVDVYNSIISVSNFIKENYEMRWNFVLEILTNMATAKIQPNLGTLNATLEILSTLGISKTCKDNVLKVLAEFKQLGIEPCLTSWYYVLITYCKERGPVSTILYDIMNEIENKEHKIQDTRDTFFFVTAMDICRNHLFDKDLAKRVHNLLMFGNNYNLIGDSFKESIYYRHYVTLLCATEPLDEFMENIYYDLIPHIYVPEPGVMMEILKTLESNCAVEYLPKIWSDIVIFDHANRENLITKVMQMMVDNEPFENKTLSEQFNKIAWDIYERVMDQLEKRLTNKITLTGELLGQLMTVLLRGDDFVKASKIMDQLDALQGTVVGVPKIEALSLYIDHCIKEKSPSKAINCIQYCADAGFTEAESFAAKLDKELTLDETHLSTLGRIVRGSSSETKEKESQ